MRNPGCDQDYVFVKTLSGEWVPTKRDVLKAIGALFESYESPFLVFDPNESLNEEREAA